MIRVDDKFSFEIDASGRVHFFRHDEPYPREHGNLEHALAHRIEQLELEVKDLSMFGKAQ